VRHLHEQFATAAIAVSLLALSPGCGGGGGGTQTNTPVTPVQSPNPLPSVSSIAPTGAQAGGSGFTLTIRGSGFITTSAVRWKGQSRTSTFVSPGELTVAIPASDIVNPGLGIITVTNPAPGGGTSVGRLFPISGGTSQNDTCPDGATPITNGRLTASLSPYGDLDVYSFEGTQGRSLTIETFAERLELDSNSTTIDSFADTVLELLDSNCARLTFNDDLESEMSVDSRIQSFVLPATGKYFIRVRDFRSDGRPDLIYDLQLSGTN
jgi:hypothetical protein